MSEKLIKHLVARPDIRGPDYSTEVTIVWKVIGEEEGTERNLLLDGLQMVASQAQVRFRRGPSQGWAIADTLEHEIELNPTARSGRHSANKPLAYDLHSQEIERATTMLVAAAFIQLGPKLAHGPHSHPECVAS